MPYQFGQAQGSPSNTDKLSLGSDVINADFERKGCEKSKAVSLRDERLGI